MMPDRAATQPANASTSHIDMWIPGSDAVMPTAPKWKFVCENCSDISQADV